MARVALVTGGTRGIGAAIAKRLTGGAILDDDGRMVGSVALVDFPSREDLDRWLATDPYVTEGVWRHIEVRPFRVAL